MSYRVQRLEQWQKRRKTHPQKVKFLGDRYRANNRPKLRAYKALRKAAELWATPSWSNLAEIRMVYESAEYLTRLTGVQFEVDHIVPLQCINVCGLHVSANLQCLTREENRAKSNKFAA